MALTVAAICPVTGCGIGFGPGDSTGVAEVLVTRDFGHRTLERTEVGITESGTAISALDEVAEVGASYGGRFVESIDGVEMTTRDGRSYDWFYFVNGIQAEEGAAEFSLRPRDRVWWDYRDWTGAMDAPAVVGSYPSPLSTGYRGDRWPVWIECRTTAAICERVRRELADDGVRSGAPSDRGIPVVVGEWGALGTRGTRSGLDSSPSRSGVFVRFEPSGSGEELVTLDPRLREVESLGPGTGLVAATREQGQPPVWLVTGVDADGVLRAADALEPDRLERVYALAVTAGRDIPLPEGRSGQ